MAESKKPAAEIAREQIRQNAPAGSETAKVDQLANEVALRVRGEGTTTQSLQHVARVATAEKAGSGLTEAETADEDEEDADEADAKLLNFVETVRRYKETLGAYEKAAERVEHRQAAQIYRDAQRSANESGRAAEELLGEAEDQHDEQPDSAVHGT